MLKIPAGSYEDKRAYLERKGYTLATDDLGPDGLGHLKKEHPEPEGVVQIDVDKVSGRVAAFVKA